MGGVLKINYSVGTLGLMTPHPLKYAASTCEKLCFQFQVGKFKLERPTEPFSVFRFEL